jgi:hypothetical protein
MRHAYFLKHRNDNMTKPPTSYVTDKMIGVFFVKVVFLYKMRKIYRNEKNSAHKSLKKDLQAEPRQSMAVWPFLLFLMPATINKS